MRSLLFLLLLPIYAQAQLTPTLLTQLSDDVSETSGLLLLNGTLWTHNDAGNPSVLYQVDTSSGAVLRTVEVNTTNVDWEDITTDGTYVYIGDIGNNSGARTDLRIHRFPIELLQDQDVTSVDVETIGFAYEDQQVFEPAENANDWDCEAMIARDDSIFLFTKNWIDQQTRLYALPAAPGDQVAELRATYNVQGMVTGAAYDAETGQVVLVGYTNGLFVPFMVRLSGFEGTAFFSGSVLRETFSLAFVQVEGVEWNTSEELFISNEASPFSQPRLWSLPMENTVSTAAVDQQRLRLFPNPANAYFNVEGLSPGLSITVHDAMGRQLITDTATDRSEGIPVTDLAEGFYLVRVHGDGSTWTSSMIIRR